MTESRPDPRPMTSAEGLGPQWTNGQQREFFAAVDAAIEARRTIGASDNPAVLGGMRAKNNGRYNGNGREWRTPPELFASLDAEFHFTLDPCSTDANALCARHFTELDNGLEQDWERHRVFMNPPYGAEVAAWTAKARAAAEDGALVVGLLPASADLEWWHRDVLAAGAEIRYLRGRVRFLTDGPYRASGFFASVVVIWRPRLAIEAEAQSSHSDALDADRLARAIDAAWRREGSDHSLFGPGLADEGRRLARLIAKEWPDA